MSMLPINPTLSNNQLASPTKIIFSSNPIFQNNTPHDPLETSIKHPLPKPNTHAMINQTKAISLMLKVFHVAHNFTLPKSVKQVLANEA